MNTLTADAGLQATLGKLSEPTEIRDQEGNVVGYYTPVSHDKAQLYAEARAHFDPDEMTHRKESGEKGRTTVEVLERLRSREGS
jgi:hypothetical protein